MSHRLRGHLLPVPLRRQPVQIELAGLCPSDPAVHSHRNSVVRQLLPIDHRTGWDAQLSDSTHALSQNMNYGEEVEEIKVYARTESEEKKKRRKNRNKN